MPIGAPTHDHPGITAGHPHPRPDPHPHPAATADEPVGRARRRQHALVWSLGLNLAVLVAEVVGGLAFHSLALLADGAHLFTDVLGLGLALVATRIITRPATDRHTYGWGRFEVLAGFVNGLLLAAVSVVIVVEAVDRLSHPAHVVGLGVVVVAAVGLAVNVACAVLLRRVMGQNLNLRAAWLHMAADALGSLAAIAAGVAVLAWQATWVDPVASLLVTALLAWATWGLLRDAAHVLLEGAPSEATAAVTAFLRADASVADVHHLHVWGLTSEDTALSAHVVLTGSPTLGEAQAEGARLKRLLATEFGIGHSTLELEHDNCADGADRPQP